MAATLISSNLNLSNTYFFNLRSHYLLHRGVFQIKSTEYVSESTEYVFRLKSLYHFAKKRSILDV